MAVDPLNFTFYLGFNDLQQHIKDFDVSLNDIGLALARDQLRFALQFLGSQED